MQTISRLGCSDFSIDLRQHGIYLLPSSCCTACSVPLGTHDPLWLSKQSFSNRATSPVICAMMLELQFAIGAHGVFQDKIPSASMKLLAGNNDVELITSTPIPLLRVMEIKQNSVGTVRFLNFGTVRLPWHRYWLQVSCVVK